MSFYDAEYIEVFLKNSFTQNHAFSTHSKDVLVRNIPGK